MNPLILHNTSGITEGTPSEVSRETSGDILGWCIEVIQGKEIPVREIPGRIPGKTLREIPAEKGNHMRNTARNA